MIGYDKTITKYALFVKQGKREWMGSGLFRNPPDGPHDWTLDSIQDSIDVAEMLAVNYRINREYQTTVLPFTIERPVDIEFVSYEMKPEKTDD